MLKYLLLCLFLIACGQEGDTHELHQEQPICPPEQGEVGPQGEPGESIKGDTGATGQNGVDGADGKDGTDGQSCSLVYKQVPEQRRCNVFIRCGDTEQYLRKIRRFCEDIGVEYE
jgi:hypothetical protein